MEIEHHIDIDATAAVVWALTIDVERWPEITSTMTTVELQGDGPPEVGSIARIKQPGQRTRTWTVTEVEPRSRFVWGTKLGTVNMAGKHLIEERDGGVRNTVALELTGFGSRVLGIVAKRTLAKALATENEGFKARAELVAKSTD